MVKLQGRSLRQLQQKRKIVYKSRTIRLAADFSQTSTEARRKWDHIFENGGKRLLFHIVQLHFHSNVVKGRIKTF